jgi:hypothetical protein
VCAPLSRRSELRALIYERQELSARYELLLAQQTLLEEHAHDILGDFTQQGQEHDQDAGTPDTLHTPDTPDT